MPYTPPATYTTGGNFTAANGNNLEAGMVGAYSQLESITANDATGMPASNGPWTLANFVNYFATLIKAITGKANWRTLPATSIEALNTNKADLSGATFTGTVNVSSGSLQKGGVGVVTANAGLTGKFSAQSSAPGSPADGDLWLDTSVILS